MRSSRCVPLLAAALSMATLWVALPSGATHAGSFEGSIPAEASNHAYESLLISGVAGTATNSGSAQLANATVRTSFEIRSSAGLIVKESDVGTRLSLVNVTASKYSGSFIGGVAYVNASSDLEFHQMVFHGEVVVSGSGHVHFNASKFEACVRIDEVSSNITFTDPQPARCASPSPSPSPSPTSSPSPSATKPTSNSYDAYVYELEGEAPNVYVRGADRVMIRNSVILGPLYVGASANVVLENVQVSGDVIVDQGVALAAKELHVGGDLRFTAVTDFRVAGGSVGGALSCLKCVRGTFQDLVVGGSVDVRESFGVERLNVQTQVAVEYSPPPPATEPGALMLNVSDEGMAFTHQSDVGGEETGVRLDFSPVAARARLELAPASEASGRPGLALESHFEKIVEFEDRNGDGGYDLSDLVVREYLVDDLKASIAQERLAGEEAWRGRIDYALPSGGTFSLIFTAQDAAPDNTKIDVAFLDYPYASPESRLALQVRLASASDWDVVRGEAEDRLVFHGDGIDGYFGWLHAVQADGQNASVVARVLEEHRSEGGDREVVLYLAYPQARDILHDPSIGLLEASSIFVPELGNLLVYGTTLVAVLAVLWALGQSGRRRVS